MTTSEQLQIAKEALEKITKRCTHFDGEKDFLIIQRTSTAALKEISSVPEEKEGAIEDEFLREMELGLGSAIAIFNECEIKIPESHPDPEAVGDCEKNVYIAYEIFKSKFSPKVKP